METLSQMAGFAYQYGSWLLFALTAYWSWKLLFSAWLGWRQQMYRHNIKWSLYEIKIPRETTRGPKAMEQFFAGIYNILNSPEGPKEAYWDGEITRWFSFEIVGEAGVTRFFTRIPTVLAHPFISSFYAQYPEIELVPADHDYIWDFPDSYQALKKQGYEMYGLETYQLKDPAFSFKTYTEFEGKIGDEKGRIIDPMAAVIEIVGKMRPSENLWIQFLAQPDTKGWRYGGADKVIEKLKSGKKDTAPSENTSNLRIRFRTKGEEKTLKYVEEKRAMSAFETTMRMVYFAHKSVYNPDLPNRGVFGYLAQFNNEDQRMKKINRVRTKVDWDAPPFIFPQRRLFWKRVQLYEEYRDRFIPEETFMGKMARSRILRLCIFHKPLMLSAAELATFFHIPTNVVLTSGAIDRIESKRVSAPSNLPTKTP